MSAKLQRVSVLIRTKDMENYFRELLESLSRQTLQPSEIVVVDNFSSKSKLNEMADILKDAKRRLFNNWVKIKIVPITDEEFSYPYSANVGISIAEHDLVCMTNGHCLPLSDKWLESGAVHFECQGVAGVGGYTLPHKNGTRWERLAFDWGWRRLHELSKAYLRDNYFSTANCILRRPLWEEYPFDEKMPKEIPNAGKFGGEDHDWGLEMLARGFRLVVEPKFDVYHSHGDGVLQLITKYLVWRRIRKTVSSLKRPRKSYTRLRGAKPLHYDL